MLDNEVVLEPVSSVKLGDGGWIYTMWLIVTKREDDLLSAMARGQNNSQEASQ
jgi:hypothetical protein